MRSIAQVLRSPCKHAFVSRISAQWLFCPWVAAIGLAVPSARGAVIPDIGGNPVHTERDDYAGAVNTWALTVFSYVFDSPGDVPAGFAIDPDEMLFVYLLEGGGNSSVDGFTVGNANAAPVSSTGWEDDIIPDGFGASDFQAPFTSGYSGSSGAAVYFFGFNPFDPSSTLDPGEYSVVWYRAETDNYTLVDASASGGGQADTQSVPGPGAPVPEPATLALLALGSAVMLRRRRGSPR